MDIIRVWNLYRVSTKSQVNKDEDIPMQRNACHAYAKNMEGWEITKELYERGISGWKKSESERDELQQIKEGAIKGEFDVLLVYYSDRLSRKKDEAPLILEFLKTNNVSVYSVNEGELRAVEHTDSLINYIRFWQNEGESKKTSIRIKSQIEQMNEVGAYTGGNICFGYDAIETDEKHPKKDKQLKVLQINEQQAEIVKIIFDLSVNKGYGRNKIASYLNSKGYVNQFGKGFNDKFIYRLLNNPIYIGRKRYSISGIDSDNIDFKTQPYNEKLRIIEDKTFYDSQKMIKNRKVKLKPENEIYHDSTPNSSKVLLSGIIKCGYCNKNMKTDYSYKDYLRKTDGKTTRMITYRYRCLHANNGMVKHEKSQVGSKGLDKYVEDVVIAFTRNVDLTKLEKDMEEFKLKKIDVKKNEIIQIEQIIKKHNRYLKTLNEEIPKALLGESKFSAEMLNNVINQTNEDLEKSVNDIENFKEEVLFMEEESKKDSDIVNHLKNWEEKFRNVDLDSKKVLLSKLIKNVVWKKDEVEIEFKDGIMNK